MTQNKVHLIKHIFQRVLRHKYSTVIVMIVWISFVGVGWTMLSYYQNTPGQSPSAPHHWPSLSKIPRMAGLPALIMFIHPHCPCSRASMSELSLIMAHCQHQVKAYVIFVKLQEFSQEWAKADLWHRAVQIPGVQALVDDLGQEAVIFHANVSGQTMLYDSEGKLVFSGGITSSRGHEGDNYGKEAIISFLNTGGVFKEQTPFLGCALFNHQEKS